jgi:hypothetical protein
VTVDASREALTAKLILAWPQGGADQFAVKSGSRAASTQLAAAFAQSIPEAANADVSSASQLETESLTAHPNYCGGEGASCAGGGGCCSGLSCYGPDNHETCNCGDHWHTEYMKSGFAFYGPCYSFPENPLGEGFWWRYVDGCGHYGLVSGMCGTAVVPLYTKASFQYYECFTGNPC